MEKVMKKSILFLALLMLNGCAVKQSIFLMSNRPGAHMFLNGKYLCDAPCEAEVVREPKQKMIICAMKGYVSGVLHLNYYYSPYLWKPKYQDTVFCEVTPYEEREKQ